MTSIKIFVEGGGATNASGQAELRVAFDTLLKAQKEAARKRRVTWTTVFCGGRGEAVNEFAKAVKRADAEFVVLVVDAEDPVASKVEDHPTPEERVRHLEVRDGWAEKLRGGAPDCVHLMTRCIEAWLVADGEKVAGYYGQHFHGNALPKRRILDGEEKAAVYGALERATKDTKKGSYGKIKHASALLKLVRPDVVAERCVSFQQLTMWLEATIAGA